MYKGQLVLFGIALSGYVLSGDYMVTAIKNQPTCEQDYPGRIYEFGMAISSLPPSIGFTLLGLSPFANLDIFFKLEGSGAFLMAATYFLVAYSRKLFSPEESRMIFKERGIAMATLIAAAAVWNGQALIELYTK